MLFEPKSELLVALALLDSTLLHRVGVKTRQPDVTGILFHSDFATNSSNLKVLATSRTYPLRKTQFDALLLRNRLVPEKTNNAVLYADH